MRRLALVASSGNASEQLAEALPRWLKRCPLYSGAAYAACRDNPCTAENWDSLPYITKRNIRENFPHNFLGPGTDVQQLLQDGKIELEYTAGTSEERTPLLLPSGWWAEQEARAIHMNAHVSTVLRTKPGARRVTVNSPMCSNDISYTGVPSHAERCVGNSLFVSLSRLPFLWSEYDLQRMTREMLEWEPVFMDVDPVYAVKLALYCEIKGVRIPGLQFILSTYEYLSAHHRRILQRVFGVPVYNLYGSTETGHLLMEVTSGIMNPSPGTAYLEIVDADEGGIGKLVVTTLTNEYMPLIRYQIGDLASATQMPEGVSFKVHGRAADAFESGGRRVTVADVDSALADIPGIAHYQIARLQDSWLARVVPDNVGFGAETITEMLDRLSTLTGERVRVEQVQILHPEKSGKFRIIYT